MFVHVKLIKRFVMALKRSEDISSLKECQRSLGHVINSVDMDESQTEYLSHATIVIDEILKGYGKN
jgi:hypothetical protein